MKNKICYLTLIIVFGFLAFIGCNSTKYEGLYTGTLPCADCAGIEIEITIDDGKYVIKRTYLDGDPERQNVFLESGSCSWDKTRGILTFSNDPTQQYLYRDDALIALDPDGKEITGDLAGMYVLRRK